MSSTGESQSQTPAARPIVPAAPVLGAVNLPLYLLRPLEKIEGVSTEAVLSCVKGIYSGNNEVKLQAQKFFDIFFEGMLVRGKRESQPPVTPQAKAQLSDFILSKISGNMPDQMLSALFMRGFAVIDDPNVWQSASPLTTTAGAAILAILWSRITRHEYPNFRDQVDGQVNGMTLSCGTGFKALEGVVADGTQVIVDFEAVDGNVSHGERRVILGTWNPGRVALNGPGLPQSVRVCVHAATRFQLSNNSLVLNPPIALKVDLTGAIVAIDLLGDGQVGANAPGAANISPLEPKGFAVIQNGDIVDGKLNKLTAVTWPKDAAPPFQDLSWVRLAVTNPKTINLRPYVNGPDLPQANSIIVLEQDNEDDVCIAARIVVSGAESNKVSFGPPSLAVRRVPSSVLPVTPVIQAVEPGPWNIRLRWATKSMPSGADIYDDSNQFHVGLECTLISTTQMHIAHQGRTLKEILAGIPSGSWPRDDDEWAKVRDWLAGSKKVAKLAGAPPTFSDDPKIFKFAKAGSVLIAPTKANKPDECLQWGGGDDILHWRRENYVWQMRLRSVENAEFPDFMMLSDWTLPTEPIAALPLIPEFGSQSTTKVQFPRPGIEINVNYKTQYRTRDDTALTYRLVVRKALALPASRSLAPDDLETTAFSERVIEATPPDWNAGAPYVWRFRFLDQDIAPPDTLDRGRKYQYELELQQLNRLNDAIVVVTKSKSLKVVSDPNRSIDVEAIEPSYD